MQYHVELTRITGQRHRFITEQANSPEHAYELARKYAQASDNVIASCRIIAHRLARLPVTTTRHLTLSKAVRETLAAYRAKP